MSKRRVKLVLITEDTQQDYFARHYFMERGYKRYEISSIKNPQGKGSGEQFVRKQYGIEVRVQRRKASYSPIGTGIVVVIDADTNTVKFRLDQLACELEKNGQQPRKPDEHIAIFVPKRNIETWIHYLRGVDINENDSYPKLANVGDCLEQVQRLAREICSQEMPDDAPTSLLIACEEVVRITSKTIGTHQ